MTFDDLWKLAGTMTLFQTFAFVFGLFIYRFLGSYFGTKGENLASIEDSPTLIRIQKRLDEISSISSDIGKEKLNSYLEIGRQFASIDSAFETLDEWSSRVESDEDLAKLSLKFSGEGALERISDALAVIEHVRQSKSWLLHWKVASILYAVRLKGLQLQTNVRMYGSETESWQVKRAHLLSASHTAAVFKEFQRLCSNAVHEDLNSGHYRIQEEPAEADFDSYAKALGDVGRSESSRFREKYPSEWELLRTVNAEEKESQRSAFKERLSRELAAESQDPSGSSDPPNEKSASD